MTTKTATDQKTLDELVEDYHKSSQRIAKRIIEHFNNGKALISRCFAEDNIFALGTVTEGIWGIVKKATSCSELSTLVINAMKTKKEMENMES